MLPVGNQSTFGQRPQIEHEPALPDSMRSLIETAAASAKRSGIIEFDEPGPNSLDGFITVQECAQRMTISPQTIYTWIHTGKVNFRKDDRGRTLVEIASVTAKAASTTFRLQRTIIATGRVDAIGKRINFQPKELRDMGLEAYENGEFTAAARFLAAFANAIELKEDEQS